MSEEARTRWAIALNAAIVVLCAFAWCQMVFGWGWEYAPLSGLGLSSLKYFTIQSNLLSAVVSAACVVFYLRKPDKPLPGLLHGMRLVATTGVALTFVTVEAFLSPALYGYASMHAGANLWFHLVLPLLAIVSFCVFEADRPLSVRWTFAAIVPMALYGVGYLANILANGIPGNDWYGFTAWGMERTPIVFAVMALVVWLIACGLRAANQRVYRMRAR
ncbi:MAG: hypothetical protein IKG69_09215 [Atopobiaceae bacterium]|nr:hypothetical protein [Atopobiaceae bacterium]